MGDFLVESQRQRRGMRPVGREAHRRTGAGVSRAAAGLPAPCFHERLRDKHARHGKRPAAADAELPQEDGAGRAVLADRGGSPAGD